MNTEERLEYMRTRFAKKADAVAKPVGLFCAKTGTQPAPKLKPSPITRGEVRSAAFVSTGRIDRLKNVAPWLFRPEEKKDRPLRIKRTERVSPLTRISKQLPVKLAVISDSEMRYKLAPR